MIASENFVSERCLRLRFRVYQQVCRGVSGRRYYGGCEYADVVENLARDRAKQLFAVPGVEIHANVQPHSGRRPMPQRIWPFWSMETRFWGLIWRMAGI